MHKDVEEILELIWTFKERSVPAEREKVVKESKVDGTSAYLDEMLRDKLIEQSDDIITLTPEGDTGGEGVIRRLRLAEWLLSNVLELEKDDKIDFKIKAKQFVKIDGQMAAIIPYEIVAWEKLFWFLKFLIPKLNI